jgi:hypothetical protein
MGMSRPSAWRRFFSTLTERSTWTVQDRVADYLDRHERDLAPELRIMLEHRAV